MKILCIVFSAALLCSCAPARDSMRALVRLDPSCAQERLRLTIVGDSLARGWGASSAKTSFASLVYAELRRENPKTTIDNLGTPGATTDEIATAQVPRIQPGSCSLVIVISGANDVQKLYTPGHFRGSYARLLRKIRAILPRGALVVLGLPDVSLSPRIPWFLKPIESRLSKDANTSIATAARAYGAAFVPLYALSREEASRSMSLLSRDGIHPNDAGYRLMARAALPAIGNALKSR